MMHYVN